MSGGPSVSARASLVADPKRIALRAALPDDLGRLGEWNAALIRDEGHDNSLSVEQLTGRMRDWLSGDYHARIFVCEHSDAGYVLYRDLPEFIHLRQFFVLPERRRRGIGGAALRALRENAFPRGKRILVEAMVWNAPALAFWRASGFGERYVGLQYPPSDRVSRP